ncbi:MAG: hypothetical protein U0002_08600 [Thermoanaerobaculia bacterium]
MPRTAESIHPAPRLPEALWPQTRPRSTASAFQGLRRHWPLWLVLAAFAGVVALIASFSYRQAGGRLLYTYDDAWIQLAIARNFAQHGVWGVSPDTFASASSSPLWCLLIAAIFKVAGVWSGISLLLNLLCASGVIALAYGILQRLKVAAWASLPLLLLMVAGAPLHGIVFVGLEHSLHSLLSLAFLFLAAEEVTLGEAAWAPAWWLPALAALLPITRYEGLFVLLLGAAFLALRRRFGRAALVAGLGLAPVVAFGAYSLAHGGYFLPNSVLLKAGLMDASPAAMLMPFRPADYDKLWKHPDLLLLALGGALAFLWRLRRDGTPWRTETLLPLWSTLAILAQVRYGALGWLFRYEVYVITAGVVAVGAAVACNTEGRKPWLAGLHPAAPWAALLVCVFLLVPFGERAERGTYEALYGGRDRWIEHVLPAQFVAAFYPHASVVFNDIGAVGFYSQARILDLVGLGSEEPLRLRRLPQGFTKVDVERWTREQNAELAVLQVPWKEIEAITPDSWVAVATIRLPEDVVYHNRAIRIYACHPDQADRLRQQVEEFLAPRYAGLEGKRPLLRLHSAAEPLPPQPESAPGG